MIPRLLICLVSTVTNASSAFSTVSWSSTCTVAIHSAPRRRFSPSSLSSSSFSSSSRIIASVDEIIIADDATDDDVTCYITNDEEIALEGEKPHVVCTSEPEEYAWFNGIDRKAMRMAEDVDIEGNENCVLGESSTGKPEWECS